MSWKSASIHELAQVLHSIYGGSTYRVGTDYSQVLYVLPHNLAFGEEVDEIGDDLDTEQLLMLCKSIQYTEEVMIWTDAEVQADELPPPPPPDYNIPPPPPEKTNAEKLRDAIDENTALKHQIAEMEKRVEMFFRRNAELEKENNTIKKKLVMIETANTIMRKKGEPIR